MQRYWKRFQKFGLALFLVLTTALFAQQDISVPTAGNFKVLGRSLTWGSSGRGGVQNAYIFFPATPADSSCLYIANNNPTSAHAFTVTFYQTGDPQLSTFYTSPGTQGHWKIVQTIADTVVASGVNNYSFAAKGAVTVMAVISGTSTQAGNPDTADIYDVQSNVNCGSSPINSPIGSGQCSNSASVTVSNTTASVLVPTPPAGQFIHVCAYSVSSSNAASSGTYQFAVGTVGTCAAIGTVLWPIQYVNTAEPPFALGSGFGQLFQTPTLSQPLCFNQTVGTATTTASVSYYIG